MKLTRLERLILSNQYKILGFLDPDNAKDYAEDRAVFENGYELHYGWVMEHIDEDITTVEECKEVTSILTMYEAMAFSYDDSNDKSLYEGLNLKFYGFSGNDETKQMAYALYFCSLNSGRFNRIAKDNGMNSHFPALENYRAQLVEYNKSSDKNRLTVDDVKRILSVR